MSDKFKKDIKNLYKTNKLSDFEYNQLVCLNSIMGSLVSIDDSLNLIKHSLSKIFPTKI